MIFQTIGELSAEPGDPFEVCTKSCTNDPVEQQRINSWVFRDTAQDNCSIKCSLTGMQVLNVNGDIDLQAFAILLKAKEASSVELQALNVRNMNSPGFIKSFQKFIDKNRAILSKTLSHQEAAGTM